MITTYEQLIAKYPMLARPGYGEQRFIILAYQAGRLDRLEEEIEADTNKMQGDSTRRGHGGRSCLDQK